MFYSRSFALALACAATSSCLPLNPAKVVKQRPQATEQSTQKNIKKGSFHMITGCVFAGKTTELMQHVRRALVAQKDVVVLKHSIDNRSGANMIGSHDGKLLVAHPTDSSQSMLAHITDTTDMVAIDEIQFYDASILETIRTLINKGIDVVAAGIPTGFRGEPMGQMPLLLTRADKITNKIAVCAKCHEEKGCYTQRVINGVPAKWTDPSILVGGSESYEARCRDCFEIETPEGYGW